MPTFSVDFEVYCTCGEGLCLKSTTRKSRTRGMLQVVVEPCIKCAGNLQPITPADIGADSLMELSLDDELELIA